MSLRQQETGDPKSPAPVEKSQVGADARARLALWVHVANDLCFDATLMKKWNGLKSKIQGSANNLPRRMGSTLLKKFR
jgi:hypothetical protein